MTYDQRKEQLTKVMQGGDRVTSEAVRELQQTINQLRQELALAQAAKESRSQLLKLREEEAKKLRQENQALQHELEVRTAGDADTIRELRAQIRAFAGVR